MKIHPGKIASAFSEAEIAGALFHLTRDREEARELARVLKQSSGGSVHERDDLIFVLLAAQSDSAAIRVGRLWGEAPSDVLAWRDAFLAENGHPSTWQVERIDDDESPSEKPR